MLLLIAALPAPSLTPPCLVLCPRPARAATHWSKFRAHLSLLHAWSVLAPKETARPSLAKVEEIVAFLQPHLENVQGAPLQVRSGPSTHGKLYMFCFKMFLALDLYREQPVQNFIPVPRLRHMPLVAGWASPACYP